MNISVSDLRSLAEDCLRFTMHFFHLIQQSASHIYHSALPLSPKSSTFHSRALSKKTKITGFHGRSDAWGIVLRTITTEKFTCMVTFANKIAAASENGMVGIYDSVTGVLKLSLNLADPVQAITGSPDGSLLFCAHKTPSITAWDMQTGGLIHTFNLESNVEDIAISLKGRYLAYGLADGSVEVREVAEEMGGAAIWTGSPIARFCWLEPEEQLVVSTGALVDIWDIVTGTVLRSFTARFLVHRMIYSQKLNHLATMATSASGTEVAIINPRTGATAASHWIRQNPSCLAFSQTAQDLVYGMGTHGIRLLDVPTLNLKAFKYPDTITSISSLQNGTVVANFASSSIQLLSLDGGHDESQQSIISALTAHIFDQGRITAIFPTSRDHILLLETATMAQLLKIPVLNTGLPPTDDTTICASYENRMAVYYFREGDKGFLQLWGFHEEALRWTAEVDGVPEMIRISPTTVRLMTLHAMGGYTWNAQTGQLDARLTDFSSDLDIEFTSETEFRPQYYKHRVPYAARSWRIDISGEGFLPCSSERSQEKSFIRLDDAHEWVLRHSEKICWIPPGYIGSAEPSYCWVGLSLVMDGQDGMVKKLTFSSS